jgi:hypothetical protein
MGILKLLENPENTELYSVVSVVLKMGILKLLENPENY